MWRVYYIFRDPNPKTTKKVNKNLLSLVHAYIIVHWYTCMYTATERLVFSLLCDPFSTGGYHTIVFCLIIYIKQTSSSRHC